MQRLLIILGIIAIPFYELIFRCLPYLKVMAPDTRGPKELIAMAFALSIGLLAAFEGKLKKFDNKFLLLIPIYVLFNLFMSPHVDLVINGVESGDFYFWKPFAQILCFTFMILAVASMKIEVEGILNVMVWCGAIMSVYIIFQYFGFDQFYMPKTEQNFTAVAGEAFGGNLGQPTVAASFIVILVPLAIYLRRFWLAGLMVIAILVTKSDMAILALIFMAIIFIINKLKNLWRYQELFIFCAIILLPAIGLFYGANKKYLDTQICNHSSGRTEVWKNIYTDIRDGAIVGSPQDFSITGVGLGRFPFIFPDKHKSIFKQAHNEFLEFTYNCGLIGLGLLITAIYFTFKRSVRDKMIFAIFLSFAGFLFVSLGSFPFQLGAHQFYAAILVGLLHNQEITGGLKC